MLLKPQGRISIMVQVQMSYLIDPQTQMHEYIYHGILLFLYTSQKGYLLPVESREKVHKLPVEISVYPQFFYS
jgi:hypothetical protein